MSALGHKRTFRSFRQCPLYPQMQTLELSRVMSALCQKRTHAVQQMAANFANGSYRGKKFRPRPKFDISILYSGATSVATAAAFFIGVYGQLALVVLFLQWAHALLVCADLKSAAPESVQTFPINAGNSPLPATLVCRGIGR